MRSIGKAYFETRKVEEEKKHPMYFHRTIGGGGGGGGGLGGWGGRGG